MIRSYDFKTKSINNIDFNIASFQIVETEEIIADVVRQKRNDKLTASDWTQVADAPVDQEAWAAYRQALRDLPSQEGFPNEVTWPTEPVEEVAPE